MTLVGGAVKQRKASSGYSWKQGEPTLRGTGVAQTLSKRGNHNSKNILARRALRCADTTIRAKTREKRESLSRFISIEGTTLSQANAERLPTPLRPSVARHTQAHPASLVASAP